MVELTKKYFDDQFDKMAVAIARGFDDTATKTDFEKLATKTDLSKLESKVDVIQGKLDNILYK